MTHTPAPWTLNPARSTRVDLIDNAKGHAIGEIVWVDVRSPADALLIAAAPDLLEALKEATRCLAWHEGRHGTGMDHLAVETARAAIQKATGAAA